MANAGSRRQVQAQGEREEIDARLAAADLREIMGQEVGRRFVMRILLESGVEDAPLYVSNAMDLARDSGKRFIGGELLRGIRAHAPEEEFLMRREYAARERRAQLEQESNDDR